MWYNFSENITKPSVEGMISHHAHSDWVKRYYSALVEATNDISYPPINLGADGSW